MTKVYDNATDIITFARLQSQNPTSGSSYLGSDGLLKFAAEDEPRIEYAADGSLKGLLIEEQRTNLVTTSAAISGGNWISSTGAVLTENAVTAPDGTQTGSTYDTNGAYRVLYNVVSVAAGSTYTWSFYAKNIDATDAGYRVYDSTQAADIVSTTSYFSQINTSDWTRVSVSFTAPAGCSQAGVYLTSGNNGGTVAFYGAQLEVGSFPTSYIPTSGSTVTRSPDIASIPVSAFGYNDQAGTVVAEYSMVAGAFAGSPYIVQFDDGSAGSRFLIMELSNQSRFFMSVSGSTQDTIINEPISEGVLNKTAVAFVENSTGVSTNGSVAEAGDGTSTVPDGITTVRLGGGNNTNNQLNGHIKSLSYFPRRLTDAQLQSLTE